MDDSKECEKTPNEDPHNSDDTGPKLPSASHESEGVSEHSPVQSSHSLRSKPAHETHSSNFPTGLGAQAAALVATPDVLLGAAVMKAVSSSYVQSPNEVPPTMEPERSITDQTSQYLLEFLTRGYISYMFSPQPAKLYLASLFKTDPPRVYEYHFERWPSAFVVFHSPMVYSPPVFMMSGQNAWVLDYVVRSGGSVVPQQLWSPKGQGDWRRYVEQADFYMPVFFINVDGTLGVPVVDAVAGLMSLQGGTQPPPLGNKTATKIRISWPGYPPSEQQIQLRDQTPTRNPVTLERFVKHLGSRIRQYLMDCENIRVLGQGPHKWAVGYDRITFNEVMLIGVIQVSPGGWVPIIQLISRVVM